MNTPADVSRTISSPWLQTKDTFWFLELKPFRIYYITAAIQLTNSTNSPGQYPPPIKGDTIQYIYTNSQHSNPLCRVVPLELVKKEEEEQGQEIKQNLPNYDKEKYKEMILDAAESVLGIFGFDRTVYDGNLEKTKKGGRRRNQKALFRTIR